MTKLTAEIPNGEWHGTVAAMDLDSGDLERLLRTEGKMDRETETLVAVELSVGDGCSGRMRIPQVRGLLAEGRDTAHVQETIRDNPDALPLRAQEVHVTMEEFVGLFRHLKIVLTRSDLNLAGQAYVERD
ncbi:hypothetical protein CKO28_20035 [Rhodovibrio sodomensis]|uniref:Phage tail protein n=1 Tax=Rhodovibrio sodomensis TaxID=1088 RepID=A0ABS1DJC3_9PROT|nr:hypothetical protein [Rhodovibrio sodomensis]MBK1670319.1 hypothetical protein [Rhodovibrio sodomensis]